MSQINLTPADKAAIRHGIALGKVRKAAALELAQLVQASAASTPEMQALAEQVLHPTVPDAD